MNKMMKLATVIAVILFLGGNALEASMEKEHHHTHWDHKGVTGAQHSGELKEQIKQFFGHSNNKPIQNTNHRTIEE